MSAWEAKKYLQYKIKARNEHSIHSPFVFKLYAEILKNKQKYYAYDELDKIRKQLLKNNSVVEVTDLGAGSKKLKRKRKISDIAKVSVIPKKYGELLFRLVNYFQPKEILELGTSLGVSALYMRKAAPKAEIISVEGCPNTFTFAGNLIESGKISHPFRGGGESSHSEDSQGGLSLVNSSFENVFANELSDKKFDLVYIDGHHTYEATIKYFHELLKLTNENSILIFDDIYWSAGMTKAWEEIKNHSSVTLTLDLFKFGIVFFRKENKQKEHFCLRF